MSEEHIAKAILAKGRKVLTGREIDLCERIISGEFDEEFFLLLELAEQESVEANLNHESDLKLFRSLQIQFSREIAEHEREFNARICRRTERRAVA